MNNLRIITSLCVLFMFTLSFTQQYSLTGTVTYADGNPVAGVTLAVPTSSEQIEVQTDKLGNYSLSLSEGEYNHLRVRNSNHGPGLPYMFEYVAVEPLIISANTIQNIQLKNMPCIKGRVLTREGNIVSGAKVVTSKWKGYMKELPIDETTTDEFGNYKVVAETGEVLIEISGPEYSDLPNFKIIYNHVGIANGHDLKFPESPILSGVIRDFKNYPIPGITVAIVKDNHQVETQTDDNGEYSFVVSSGTISEIRVRNTGGNFKNVPSLLEYIHEREFEITKDLKKEIVLPEFIKVSGVVFDAEFNLVAGVSLKGNSYNNGMIELPMDETISDSNGYYELYMEPGENRIKVNPGNYGPYTEQTKVVNTKEDQISDIYLKKGAVFSGIVLYHDSTPVSGITVAVARANSSQREITTDENGEFSLVLEPDAYPDFRIRNTGAEIPGIPYSLEYTVQNDLVIKDTLYEFIVLPKYYKYSGILKSPEGKPVPNIKLSSSGLKNGWVELPKDENISSLEGTFELYLKKGTNQIEISPEGSLYAKTFFTLDIQDDLKNDIHLTLQSKGIARIQPSVISQGKSGEVILTGVNSNFLNGFTGINLGEGVEVEDFSVVSDISIKATIKVAEDAPVGTRSISVKTKNENLVGTQLFTVTAPSSGKLSLDKNNVLQDYLVISDGTGTELSIAAGTKIILPEGADHELSFDAPIIKNNDINPEAAKFLQVQREFSPSGVVFDPPAQLTYHYQDQDVEEIDELSLVTYKYDNKADTVVKEYQVISRDTAANVIIQEASTFSLFRLASSKNYSSNQKKSQPKQVSKMSLQKLGSGYMVSVNLNGIQTSKNLRLKLTNVRGQIVSQFRPDAQNSRYITFHVSSYFISNKKLSGVYFLNVEGPGLSHSQQIYIK